MKEFLNLQNYQLFEETTGRLEETTERGDDVTIEQQMDRTQYCVNKIMREQQNDEMILPRPRLLFSGRSTPREGACLPRHSFSDFWAKRGCPPPRGRNPWGACGADLIFSSPYTNVLFCQFFVSVFHYLLPLHLSPPGLF